MRWFHTASACAAVACFFLCLGGDAAAQNLPATTVQLPTFGISIDADGVVEVKAFADDGRLAAERLRAAKAMLPGDLFKPSPLRKVSLRRLEAELAAGLKAGQPDDVLLHLAGLQRVQYAFCYPAKDGEPGDIVLAGPAEGWLKDAAGRSVGATTGKPTLLLEDLAVALRAYPPGGRDRPFLGCTIDPRAESLERVQAFQKTIPRSVRPAERQQIAEQVGKGMQQALGMADVRVFGISPRTHFAEVLIEADYRMKLIGIGAEQPPVKMATFISSLDSPKNGNLQRWWFTPNYDCLRVTDDRLGFELVGQGVQLQSEDKTIGPAGKLGEGSPPSKPSLAYTSAFTNKYEEIAAKSPVYAQLRGMIDLAILAAFIRKHDYYAQVDWQADVLRDERQFAIETHDTPKEAQCVAHSLWKGSRLLTPAGGGVSIVADEALEEARLQPDAKGEVAKLRSGLSAKDPQHWWWD
jgi:hypothetical protein